MMPPENGSLPYSPEQGGPPKVKLAHEAPAQSFQASVCAAPGAPDFLLGGEPSKSRKDGSMLDMRFSKGDRFNLQIPGAADYTGDYIINADGRVILPFAEPIKAVGLTSESLAIRIERALVKARLFESENFRVSVSPVQYAPVNITIAGAVFLPGRFTINTREHEKFEKALAKTGDSALDRSVAAAMRAGGGIRPDADLSRVVLLRDGKKYRLDWRGALTGAPVDDVPLIEGDHIQVEEGNCFQSALVRPSQITPPGVRIFASNLTTPSVTTVSVSQHATSIPYGTRFLAGLVSANCVGGSLATNAKRYAVLISRNPRTRETQVIQRSIEELIRSADRDTINPFLMPDDALACYDSAVSDVSQIAALLQQIMTPVNAASSTYLNVLTAKKLN